MPIKATNSNIDQYTAEQLVKIERQLIRSLAYVGEQIVITARQSGSYLDRTGNLRSSIGYVISFNGNIAFQGNFNVVAGGSRGKNEGEGLAASLAKRFTNGIALIVVAGMNYAIHVKNRGYDVIDSGELLADRLVPRMLQELNIKVK